MTFFFFFSSRKVPLHQEVFSPTQKIRLRFLQKEREKNSKAFSVMFGKIPPLKEKKKNRAFFLKVKIIYTSLVKKSFQS